MPPAAKGLSPLESLLKGKVLWGEGASAALPENFSKCRGPGGSSPRPPEALLYVKMPLAAAKAALGVGLAICPLPL
ncbi:hypothetical protein DVDV_3082 [Desulfovibrio sp. DV]|nr:hypothetical protein DVDV_3082 [Desulfovibrio sp. DV]